MEQEELRRQMFHILLGVLIISLLYFELLASEWLLVAFLVCLALSLTFKKWKVPWVEYIIFKYERPMHIKRLPGKGPIFFLLGAWLVARFFPLDIALAALAILTFGDSLSTLISLGTGKRKHPLNNTKLLGGSIVGAIVGFLTASIFVPWWQALVAAVIAMTLEALEIRVYEWQVDDNLSIPVIAAAVIFVLQLI